MIRSAVVLFRERGIDGTSFSDVLEHSGAPRGSIYHHFPGGKTQLVEETTRYAGEFIAAGLARSLEDGEPAGAIRSFADSWLAGVEATDFTAGCPIVAAALEGDRTPAARDAAATAFERWEQLLAGAFEKRGVEPDRARALATLAIASIEGAVVLARAQRSAEPLQRVAGELERLAAAALE